MVPRLRSLPCVLLLLAPLGVLAQDHSGGFELHANKAVTAREIGLPELPGATMVKNPDHDSVDMGFTFGETHFRLKAVEYISDRTPERVLDYYRKPLSRYGDVLECNHSQPVGSLTKTRSGLTCEEKGDSKMQVNGVSSDGHELRAGTPEKMRIVGISDVKDGKTRFGLVYLELPKDTAKKD